MVSAKELEAEVKALELRSLVGKGDEGRLEAEREKIHMGLRRVLDRHSCSAAFSDAILAVVPAPPSESRKEEY